MMQEMMTELQDIHERLSAEPVHVDTSKVVIRSMTLIYICTFFMLMYECSYLYVSSNFQHSMFSESPLLLLLTQTTSRRYRI